MLKAILFRAVFLLLLCAISVPASWGQGKTITGVITDVESNAPIPGVSILIKGTVKGTITDAAGSYRIQADNEQTILVYSFIGYKKVERAVEGLTEISFSMEPDLEFLEEVVVIGYGTQKKEDLTGSVTVVDVAEMKKSNFSTIDKALQGRAAGVNISSVSGRPGESASVKIRGVGSISLSSEPLYVVDGMQLDDEVLSSINPADIASIQILKDASATAIYGARGANGVILINTRKGQAGKTSMNFSANTGIAVVPKTYDLMNASQYTDFTRAAYENFLKKYPTEFNYYKQVYSDSARLSNNNADTDTDWQDEITRVGKTNNYNLSVSGGSETSNFFISGNYTREEGILIDTDMSRFSLRANSDFKINNRLKIGESVSISRMSINDIAHYGNGDAWQVATITSPFMPVYDITATGGFGGPTDSLTGNNERTNPVGEQMLNQNNVLENRIIASIYADLDLFKGLTYTIRTGANLRNEYIDQWSPEYTLGNMRLRDNDISKLVNENNNDLEYLILNQLTYKNTFANHNLVAMAAYERQAMTYRFNAATGRHITNPDLPVLNQAEEAFRVEGTKTEHRLESILGRINYDYLGKYLLTASLRVDGSTRFGPVGGRYGYFPSFSAGWKLNEDFLQDVEQINMLKLRFGWGWTGNENLEDYQYFEVMDPLVNSRYAFGDPQTVVFGGASTSFQANPLIKWEATGMTNFGIDLNAFNNRLQATAEYYIKNQEDMLVKKPISTVFGKYVAYGNTTTVGAWANIGKVQNRGLELSASWRKLDGGFNYSITANFSTYRNEVVDLGLNAKLGTPEIITLYTKTINGHTIGSFFGHVAERILQVEDFERDGEGNLIIDANGNYKLLHAFQEQGTAPGDIKFRDLNNDGVINDLDRTIIGKPVPDFGYGLNFDASWKGFDFTLFLQGVGNLQVYNQHRSLIGIATDPNAKDNNRLTEALEYWTPENRSTTMTRVNVVDENRNGRISSWFVEDASFLRIKSIQLGYTLPAGPMKAISVERLRVYANINNLITLTKYKGYDPEVGDKDPLNQGIDTGFYPVPRVFSFGAQIDF